MAARLDPPRRARAPRTGAPSGATGDPGQRKSSAAAVPEPPATDAPAFRAALLRHFLTQGPLTRLQVAERTEWSRVTVTSRIQHLLDDGLLVEEAEQRVTTGRPATSYAFNAARGCVAVAAFGLTGVLVAWCDLQGAVQESDTARFVLGTPPEEMLEVARTKLMALPGLDPARVWGLTVGVPAPIERGSGLVVEPPLLKSWEDVDVKERTEAWFDCAVIVENDANALAYGEFVSAEPAVEDLLYVKVSTGVGAGIVANGELVRGSRGSAGDLGHIRADRDLIGPETRTCPCKRLDCIEAHAGGWAIASTLQEEDGVAGLLRRLDDNDPAVRGALDVAGRVIGAGAAQAVSLLNPALVVIGGQLALHEFSRRLVRNVQDEIEDRALGLATRRIVVRASTLGDQAAAIGLAALFTRQVLSDNETLHDLLSRTGA